MLVDAVVVDLDDPRVRELGERVVLALEQRLALLGLAVVAREAALEREPLVVARVAHEVHGAHPAAAQAPLPAGNARRSCAQPRRRAPVHQACSNGRTAPCDGRRWFILTKWRRVCAARLRTLDPSWSTYSLLQHSRRQRLERRRGDRLERLDVASVQLRVVFALEVEVAAVVREDHAVALHRARHDARAFD